MAVLFHDDLAELLNEANISHTIRDDESREILHVTVTNSEDLSQVVSIGSELESSGIVGVWVYDANGNRVDG